MHYVSCQMYARGPGNDSLYSGRTSPSPIFIMVLLKKRLGEHVFAIKMLSIIRPSKSHRRRIISHARTFFFFKKEEWIAFLIVLIRWIIAPGFDYSERNMQSNIISGIKQKRCDVVPGAFVGQRSERRWGVKNGPDKQQSHIIHKV